MWQDLLWALTKDEGMENQVEQYLEKGGGISWGERPEERKESDGEKEAGG